MGSTQDKSYDASTGPSGLEATSGFSLYAGPPARAISQVVNYSI